MTATIPFGDELATEVAVGEGAAWVGVAEGRMDSGAVLRIDPATNEIAARVPLSHQPWYLAASGSAVWVAVGTEPSSGLPDESSRRAPPFVTLARLWEPVGPLRSSL